MGLAVALQHNSKRDLRGCMILQSTTWPWRAGVSGCRQSNVLRRYRIATVRGKLFAIGCSSIATSASTSFSSVASSPSILSSPLCHRALKIRTTVVTEHPVTTLSLTKPRPPDASVDHIVILEFWIMEYDGFRWARIGQSTKWLITKQYKGLLVSAEILSDPPLQQFVEGLSLQD